MHSNGPLRAQVHLDVGNVIMIRDDLTLFLWQIELFMVQPLGVILYIDVAVTGAKNVHQGSSITDFKRQKIIISIVHDGSRGQGQF